jgi:hypothetical protein
MSMRRHPGKLSTKSAPNPRDGVTRPSPAGSELILEEISKALFAVKSWGSGVVKVALEDLPERSIASAQIIPRCRILSALLGPSGKLRTIAANPRCPIRLRNNGPNGFPRMSAECKSLVRRK